MERFARSMLAGDIMTEQVLYVLPGAPLMEAAQVLGEYGISGLPVIDEDRKVLGIVSEKDILSQLGFKAPVNLMAIVTRLLQAAGSLSFPAQILTVDEVMTFPAVTVLSDTPLLEIVKILTERKINRLPVTDYDGHLLGIVARSDIVNATLRSGTCSWNM
jgi:CBS domain-containing protein